jgi:hypothetical protein
MRRAELIGWGSSIVLLATIGRQVHTQWKARAAEGCRNGFYTAKLRPPSGTRFIARCYKTGREPDAVPSMPIDVIPHSHEVSTGVMRSQYRTLTLTYQNPCIAVAVIRDDFLSLAPSTLVYALQTKVSGLPAARDRPAEWRGWAPAPDRYLRRSA